MRVSTGFESGRVEVLGLDARRAHVAVAHDLAAPRFRQWFAFDVETKAGHPVEVVFDNASQCTWADCLGGDYRVYVSEGGAWRRGESRMEGDRLVLKHTPERPRMRVAYYPPYPSSRFAALRRRLRAHGGKVELLATTPQGRPLERLVLGHGPKRVWVMAQQHPGESMAGWFVEGLVVGLLDHGPAARALLERATVSIVPRMNPDGAAVGNHRTTPFGVDLNRSWATHDAPIEVSSVRTAMQRSGVDFALDIHGDERLPWVFGQSADRYEGRPERIARAIGDFEGAMVKSTPDYQTEHKYPYDPSGRPNTSFCSNWVQMNFECAALTLEMPFSDHRGKPDPRGFFPARARRLGRRAIAGLVAAIGA